MGIRDYLADWVEPFDAQTDWKVGDKAITTRESRFGSFTVPEGAEVTISSIPESRHGADEHALSCYAWGEHKWLEVALSAETAQFHGFGEGPGVRRP